MTDAKRTRDGGGGEWLGGLALVAIGVVFLAQNIYGEFLDNWWALFLLIPAAFTFGTALEAYRRRGSLDAMVAGPLVGGLSLLTVAAVFLFDLDWGRIWPVFVIIAGIAALVTRPRV